MSTCAKNATQNPTIPLTLIEVKEQLIILKLLVPFFCCSFYLYSISFTIFLSEKSMQTQQKFDTFSPFHVNFSYQATLFDIQHIGEVICVCHHVHFYSLGWMEPPFWSPSRPAEGAGGGAVLVLHPQHLSFGELPQTDESPHIVEVS